ncbi:helix-turn-helix domain-containing protein [Sphingobacterium sp. SGL-16]|uniref:helix-turn-helix domain-containing protein n=1 Tax=Sphingobacterium sp. SGL-16 TaxID=2710883 RepID=UPI0013EB061A|nr:helix-turn-helix domain-containing protein [Sphingobacterium sp. SGL-16]NGM71675.1 helix-turn-helix domain-containing protein [Sphingobacterium sp. SGL-16]
MSSNISVIRVCENCGEDFTARTTVTRFCSDLCGKRNYNQRQKEKKINQSNKETEKKKQSRVKQIKDVSILDYLNPTDTARLLMCSVRNVYKLINAGKLPYAQISEKKRLISRIDIDS